MIMVGIVIVNWNGFEMTRNLVIQIKQNEEQDFKMVVVNNSQGDAARFQNDPVFNEPRIQVIHSGENVGYSGGLNLGIKALLKYPEVSHFLLLNNDVVIEKSFIRQLQASAKENRKI